MISQLDRDLAGLQQAAGAWPPGVGSFPISAIRRIAVNFTLDFDSMLLRRLLKLNEPPMWEHGMPKDASLEEDHLVMTVAAIDKISRRRTAGTRGG